jgi:multicomponent K+:H+ antiporter subunit G
MMLARAALYRDRVENDEKAPPKRIDQVAARKQSSKGET